ncbi:MAG TPA: DUF924 family protein [Alphaproteobacteria bacterium]|nr:DUF924 family protein [Alphaproteobacteria bacterium]
MADASEAEDVLAFWFADVPGDDFTARKDIWFGNDPAFDAVVARRFSALHAKASAGSLTAWEDGPRSALALVIVLDQFPRNIYRGTLRAFASDPQALAVARRALNRGFDHALRPVERMFLYLPFEHSESREDQERSVALFTALEDPITLDYAVRHRDIIARFGRFPHRNAILGRPSTPAERVFLAEPNSSF